jgi:hypothetical protein
VIRPASVNFARPALYPVLTRLTHVGIPMVGEA